MKQEINVLKNDIYRDIYSFSTKRWILVIFRTFKVVSYDAIFVVHWFSRNECKYFWTQYFIPLYFILTTEKILRKHWKLKKQKLQEFFEKRNDICYSIEI